MNEGATGWQPMDTAPKDRPILGLCRHDADPYTIDGRRLTPYGAHAEGLSHVADGLHVLEWGGGYSGMEDDDIGSDQPMELETAWDNDDDYDDRIAEDAAVDYYNNHDGQDAVWPLDIEVFYDGQSIGKFLVSLEFRPIFSATKL